MTGRILSTVDQWAAGEFTSTTITVDTTVLDRLTAGERARLNELVAQTVADLRQAGVGDPAAALAAEATIRRADSDAYRREAARRGVLAL